MSIESIRFCEACAKVDAERDKGLTQPKDIFAFRNMIYADRDDYNTLDVYYPVGTDKKLPTILNIHGGGYVYGDTKLYQFYCMNLAQRGFSVVSFNYRLAPDYPFPSPLEDINSALEWIVNNCDEYYLDTDNVFLIGDSAGAQLASQYGVIYSNLEYANLFGLCPPDVKIRAMGLNCGMYDLAAMLANAKETDSKVQDYFTPKFKEFGKMLDPLAFVNESYPPSHIMSAPGDFLSSNCEPMSKFLTAKNVENEWILFGDEKTYHVFHVDIKTELAKTANDCQCDFLKKHIV